MPLLVGALLVTDADLAARHAHPAREDPQGGRAAARAHRHAGEEPAARVKGTAVFLTSDPDIAPAPCCTTSSTTRSCTSRTWS